MKMTTLSTTAISLLVCFQAFSIDDSIKNERFARFEIFECTGLERDSEKRVNLTLSQESVLGKSGSVNTEAFRFVIVEGESQYKISTAFYGYGVLDASEGSRYVSLNIKGRSTESDHVEAEWIKFNSETSEHSFAILKCIAKNLPSRASIELALADQRLSTLLRKVIPDEEPTIEVFKKTYAGEFAGEYAFGLKVISSKEHAQKYSRELKSRSNVITEGKIDFIRVAISPSGYAGWNVPVEFYGTSLTGN